MSVQNTAQRVGEGGVVVGVRGGGKWVEVVLTVNLGSVSGPIHTTRIVGKYVSLTTVKLDQQ